MQSQSNPKEYDAVLGGKSIVPVDAAVLGGVQGAISRLKHGDYATKVEALKYLQNTNPKALELSKVLELVYETLQESKVNGTRHVSFPFYNAVIKIYANIDCIETGFKSATEMYVPASKRESIIYEWSDDSTFKYELLELLYEFTFVGSVEFGSVSDYFQDKQMALLKVAKQVSIRNFAVAVYINAKQTCFNQMYSPEYTHILRSLLQPLLYLNKRTTRPPVKRFGLVTIYKLKKLFGETWFFAKHEYSGRGFLMTYVPADDQIKHWLEDWNLAP